MQSGGDQKSTRADIVIVGGGPATLGLLTNAMKQNRLHELVSTGDGLAVIEQGMTLGGGELQNFGVNSNTSARGFLKCAYKRREVATSSNHADNGDNNNSNKRTQGEKASPAPKKKKQPDGDQEEESEDELAEDSERCDESDEEQASPQKQWQTLPLNCFKDLYQLSPIYKTMAEYGSRIVPLAVVGMYLNYCGNHLLHYIYQVMRKRVFYPCHRVTSIQLLQNGDVLTHAVKRVFTMKVNAADGTVTFGTESTQNVTFRSKAVIVSNGGRQQLPPTFFKQWFPFLKDRMDRVLLSDNFMKRDIYKKTMAMIKEQKLKRIVIIGASHSGFSCAWLLLFGPATWRRNNALVRSGQAITRARFPDAPLKSNPHCGECCSCSEAKKQKNPKCDCLCKCWGYFKYEDWDFDHDKDLPTHYGPSSIKILYRDKVRVFYGTVNQAKADGYTEFSEHVFSNPRGFVYSYTGLRSDSKWLYRQVKHGHEKRVALVAAPKPEDQAEHLRDADLVIWACGYHTNKIPIKDHEGKEITLSQRVANTQFDVDGKCRVCVSDGSLLTKTFGTGLAYPTRTNDGMIRRSGGKPDPRADSFSLYCGWIGNRVLQNILPKTQLEGKLQRTMRNNRKQAIENNANNNNNNQAASPTKKGNGKADGVGKNQGHQAPGAARKPSTSKTRKADSASKKQRVKQQMGGGAAAGAAVGPAVVEEGSAEEADGERAGTPARNGEKAKSTSPFGVKDAGEAKETVSKAPEAKEGSKKTASHGGYLRGTLASETRAKLVKANAVEQETYAHATPEKAAPASSGGGIYIPPQITHSQQQYIQRRKEAIEKEQAELQQLMDKHKPPPPQQRNHAGVQSRYLKQAATVAANAAKKVDAANKASTAQVKKSTATPASKTKNKEKAKLANPEGNEPVPEQEDQPLVTGDGSHGEERKDDKAAFSSTTEKAINNYISQQTAIPTAHHYHPSQSTQPSPSQLHSSSPPPPTDSANNTWSASTAEGERGKQPMPEGQERRGKEDVTFTRHERDISSPDGLNDAEESILLSRAPAHGHLVLRDHRQMSRMRRASKGMGDGDHGSSSSLRPRGGEVTGTSDVPEPSWAAGQEEEGSGARQVAKLSQNYMVQHSQEKPTRALPHDFNTPHKGQLFQNHNRQGNSHVRTQERKKSGHPLIHSHVDGSPGGRDTYQLQGPVSRPYSKNEQDKARLEGQQNQKPVVHSMTEEKPKVGSPNGLANFQTAEPVVSRARRMQDCLEKFEALPGIASSLNQTSAGHPAQSNQVPPAHFKNQSVKAHSPDFYSSKVKFTAPFPAASGQHLLSSGMPSSASNGHPQPPGTDPIHKHHTQKLSSLFGRSEHHSGGSSSGVPMNSSQSSKGLGLSFNQYMIKQQEQALQLQNPLLLKQQQQVLLAKQHAHSAAHRPSKSQWLAQMDSQSQQTGQGHVVLQQNGAKIAGSTSGVKQAVIIPQYQNGPNQYYLPQFYQSTDHQAVKPNAFGVKATQIIIPPKNGQGVPFQGIVAVHPNQIIKTGMSADHGQRHYANQMQKQIHYLHSNVTSTSTAEYGPLNGGSNPQSLIKPPNQTAQNPQTLTKKTIFLQQQQQQQVAPILSYVPNGSQGQTSQQSPQMPSKVFQIPGLAGQTAISMMNGGTNHQINGSIGLVGHHMQNVPVKGDRNVASGVQKSPQLLPLNPPFKKVKGSMVNFTQSMQPTMVANNPLQMAGAQNLAAIINPSDISFQQHTGKELSSGSGTGTITTNFNTTANMRHHPLKKANEMTGSAGNLLSTSSQKRNSITGGQGLADMTESDIRHNNTMKASQIKFANSLSEMQQHLSVKIQQHTQATHQLKLDSGEVKVATIVKGMSPIKKPLPQFIGGDQRVVGISTAMTDKPIQQLQTDSQVRQQHVLIARGSTIATNQGQQQTMMNLVEPKSASLDKVHSGSKLTTVEQQTVAQQQYMLSQQSHQQPINTIMMNVNLNSPKQIIVSNVMQQKQHQKLHANQQSLHQHSQPFTHLVMAPSMQANTSRPTGVN